jgi:hypothetical protein
VTLLRVLLGAILLSLLLAATGLEAELPGDAAFEAWPFHRRRDQPMRSQEQAFRAYYASMTNSELLQTARNRSSFIDVAQKLLGEELKKRNFTVSPGPVPAIQHSFVWTWGDQLAKFAKRFHHPRHPVST